MRATAATLLSQSLPRALAARCRGLAPPLQRRTYERRGVVRATAGRFWRRLPDGERIGERALRLQDSSRREARLLPDTGEPIVDRVQLKELHPPHAHELDAATLHGVNNEPQPHHNEVPHIPVPRSAMSPPDVMVPPPLRVRVPSLRPFPAGILPSIVSPAFAAVTVEGPVALGVTMTLAVLVVGTAVLLGRLASRRRSARSPEEPLFRPRFGRPPRPPGL